MNAHAVRSSRPLHTIPSALTCFSDISSQLKGRLPIVLVDFDGTLAPISPDPEAVEMMEPARETLSALAERIPVGILSGREVGDVKRRVGLDGLVYAGSHGLEIEGPGVAWTAGSDALPALARAYERLTPLMQQFDGLKLERKSLGLAVHYRSMEDSALPAVERQVHEVESDEPALCLIHGKKVMELRPDVAWDKGRALLWLVDHLTPDGAAVLPIYLGDDVTDEDAFRAMDAEAVSVVVRGEDNSRCSIARFALGDPGEVSTFLVGILALLVP